MKSANKLTMACALVLAFLGSRQSAAEKGTPSASPVGETSSECTVPPLSVERIDKIIATPVVVTASPPPAERAMEDLPKGEPADAETISRATATVAEFVACAQAGSPLQALSLVSDNYLRAQLLLSSPSDVERATPSSEPSSHHIVDGALELQSVREVRVLAGGQVGAVVETSVPSLSPDDYVTFFILIEQDGRLIIDMIVVIEPNNG